MNRFIRLYYVSILLFLSVSGDSQQKPYYRTDSLMRVYQERIKTADELYKVIYYIRTNFKEDSLKLRASFIWITENIAYDVKAFIKEDPIASQINYVIKNKKAVCGGYAALLKYFCDGFNIECEVVEGYARLVRIKCT